VKKVTLFILTIAVLEFTAIKALTTWVGRTSRMEPFKKEMGR